MKTHARLLPILTMLLTTGCLGQSGSPPSCAAHCLCEPGYERAPLRGRVTQLEPLEIEVTERPADGGYEDVEVGTVIGGAQQTCVVAPTLEVGADVLVYYERGEQDGEQCPERAVCNHDCDTAHMQEMSQTVEEEIAAFEEYEACGRECPTATASACAARREEALFGGTIRVALETQEGYDFGADGNGAPILLHDEELIELSDPYTCHDWSQPSCMGPPGPLDL